MLIRNSILPPLSDNIMNRERINELLYKATRHSSVAVLAGPGFGKTLAVTAFCHKMHEENAAHIASITLRREDNDPQQLKINIAKCIQAAFPDFHSEQSAKSKAEPLDFIREKASLLVKTLSPDEKQIFILDNFERITNEEVQALLRDLMSIFQISSVCWIIISRTKSSIEAAELNTKGSMAEITQEQLAFTRDEIRDYFHRSGTDASTETLDSVLEQSEGWPLAVDVMHDMYTVKEVSSINSSYGRIINLFDECCFKKYPPQVQLLMIQLSFINSFSFDVLKSLTKNLQISYIKIKKLVENHPFITYRYASSTFHLHRSYQIFLNYKESLMPLAEKDALFRTVGEIFNNEGRFLEAIFCFEAVKDNEMLLQIISKLSLHQLEISACNYVCGILKGFPADFKEENPQVDLLLSYIELFEIKIDESAARLAALELRIRNNTDEKSLAQLGETYLLMATISIMKNQDSFVEYYKKAAEAFPENGDLSNDMRHLLYINSKIYLSVDEPGEIERMMGLISSCIPYLEHFHEGAGQSFYGYYAMEAAYLTFDLSEAERLANKYTYIARENSLGFYVLHGLWKLLEISFFAGNLNAVLQRREQILEFAENCTEFVCAFLRDQVEIYFDVLIGNLDNIPKWFVSNKNVEKSRLPILIDKEGIIYGFYLLHSENYTGLIYYLYWFEKQYKNSGTWLSMLRSRLLRAVAYMKLDKNERAVEELHSAYKMTCKNKIITPFLDLGKDMRTLIKIAERTAKDRFDPAWLELIHQKSSTFAKKEAVMEKEYFEKIVKTASNNKLSKRELDVLTSLAQGLTREEIADLTGVSSGTVKTIIKQIYNKLDAVNNAAAVRIAYETGIFKPDTQLR